MEWWQAALVAAVTGLGSGAVGSLLAPWSQWGVEKRRARDAHRRDLLRRWHDILVRCRGHGDQIINDPDFPTIRGHLTSDELRRLELSGNRVTVVDGASGISADDKLSAISDAIDRIRREWKLD